MEIVAAGKPFASLRAAQGKGDQSSMTQSVRCSRMDCSNQGVTPFGEENLCFDHFCNRCYELLERADHLAPHSMGDYAALAALLYRLDECAQRALEISLSEIEMNNLDRARLLDILLWSGDVTSMLRRKRGNPDSKFAREQARTELLEGPVGRGG
jgi:hypothetical protein